MDKINKKMKKIDKCKCTAKVKSLEEAKIQFNSNKNKQLVKIVEKKIKNGATVFTQFYFDKKTGELIGVNLQHTVFYFQEWEFFSVVSEGNFDYDEASDRASVLIKRAKKLKSLKN